MAISNIRNNYFKKPRRNVNMYVIYIRHRHERLFFPKTDVHGNCVGYPTKGKAAADLYECRQMNGKRNAYLQRVGPIC